MTEADIHRALHAIEDASGDYEIAHVLEDKLLWAFVDWIANEKDIGRVLDYEIRAYARLIQKSKLINFPKHCA